jgi:alpha-mannosidase
MIGRCANGMRLPRPWSLRTLPMVLMLFALASSIAAQNNLERIENGGHIGRWLISNTFPAEIDAGMWENFNRFNIEALPRKDWLAPFGSIARIKPAIGTFKASETVTADSGSEVQNPRLRADLPEVGEVSNAKPLPDATEISWTEFTAKDGQVYFHAIQGGKTIGTSYAAAYLESSRDELRYIETDGFLGAIWLNGEKIYDGYTLNVRKTAIAKFNKGKNLLIVRASGVASDYWRRDGGWNASIRLWNTAEAAAKAAAFTPNGVLGTVYYLEGFHVDPVYLQDQRGYSKVTLSNVSQYMQSLRADKRYGVYLSEIDYLKPYLDTHPEDREFIKQTVAEGRVGSGGAYNQPNPMNTGGEAFIRNIMYGQFMHEAMLGRRSKSLALWDVFGHIPQLSQIVNKSGFNGVAWSKKITGFQPFFYDYALDGSRALHRRLDYAYSFSGFGSGKNYSFDNFRKMTERKFEEARSFGSSVDVRINAADFTPPWTNLAGNVKTLDEQKPRIVVTGQAQDLYFDALKKEIADGKVKPPVTSRDKLFFHVGVMMARSDLKVAHRHTENMVLNAERFATLAYLRGGRYPDLVFDKAWRQIFFGSHHDAITGTPSDSAMLDLIHGYREAFEMSKSSLHDSLHFLSAKIDTTPKSGSRISGKTVPVIVFNPMNWTRTDVVRVKVNFPSPVSAVQLRDEKGDVITPRIVRWDAKNPEIEFLATDIPSLGYKTFYAEETRVKSVTGSGSIPSIENEHYRITVDPKRGGAITSIYDKQARREVINATDGQLGNEIAVLREELTKKNVIYPAWELWTTGEKSFSTASPAKVSFNNEGPTNSLTIEGTLPNKTKYRQHIVLYDGVKRIDFKTELLDYNGKDELFAVNFPLNIKNGAFVTEDRFGTVTRNTSKGFLDYRTNTDKLVSGAPVYGVYNWAGYGPSETLRFTQSGKETVSVPLKSTALVRPQGSVYEKVTEKLVSQMITRGISITPFYDDNETARRSKLPIEDSMMPKSLNDDIAHHGMRISLGGEKDNAYSAKLMKQVSAETKAAFEARLARDGYAVLFAYDSDVPQGWRTMPVIVLAGDIEKAAADFADGELPSETFAKETLKGQPLPVVPNHGVALINKGTPGVSLENPDTLTLLLTHTALFPGINLPFDYVPENKTHVFEYALVAHENDWKKADVVKAGYDFNNPLIAVQSELKKGELKAQGSLMEVSEDTILSALKLSGEPHAKFTSPKERWVVARFYESEGTDGTVRIKARDQFDRYADASMLEEFESSSEVSGEVNASLTPFEIKTLMLRPRNVVTTAEPEKASEIVQPVYSRYWLHNMGAAPLGNDAVKVSLRPVEQMGALTTFSWDDPYNQGGITTSTVRVQVVNNYRDRSVKGTVKLEVPADWRIVPDTLEYDIAPEGSFVQDVVVLTYPVKKNDDWERAGGLVKAFIEHDGQRFYDVLQIGKPFKLEWKTEITDKEVLVKIRNPHRQSIEGAVAMVKPYEAWMFAPSNAQREIGFSVPARGEIVLSFPKDDVDSQSWSIARLVYNGWLEYLRADDRNSK